MSRIDSFNNITEFSAKEMEQFKSICNHLLSRTFVVRTIIKSDNTRINNPDYTFLSIHYETVREYLSLLDWDLRKNDFHGYFYVINTDESNRLNLNKTPTAILLALRMIYEENQERVGLEHDVIITVRDVMEKIVTDYAILSTRPSMDEIRRALTIFANHSVIQCLEGRFGQASCKFAILPTILTVVSAQKLDAVVATLQKEDEHEDTNEDTTD